MPCLAMSPIHWLSLRSPVSVRVLPFVRLHGPQGSTRFSSSFGPPSLLGMQWSTSNVLAQTDPPPAQIEKKRLAPND